ncbi:hypothetical protein [Nocardia sp. alder85J]|uniref:hypothetical protein n=1 Tax=Nocardia sp. alder85J TaxID=2862949 RepID=UPI001CD6742D|nr:hypothetical protein [Nocardia sp. alder85J]MCX4094426.1 hypothetical protein [Nocardia sp. alder85J]
MPKPPCCKPVACEPQAAASAAGPALALCAAHGLPRLPELIGPGMAQIAHACSSGAADRDC